MENIALSIASILLSGVLSTFISNWHYKKQLNKQIKINLLDNVFGYRFQMTEGHAGSKSELMQALNRIPLVFSDCSDVIQAYDNFFEAVEVDTKNSTDKLTTLLKKMCKNTGIKCENWNDRYITKIFTLK